MDVHIQSTNIDLTNGFYEQVEQRLGVALDDCADRISEVGAHLEAVNTTEDALGMTCRICLDIKPYGTLTAQATDVNVYVALDRVACQVRRRLGGDKDRMQPLVTQAAIRS